MSMDQVVIAKQAKQIVDLERQLADLAVENAGLRVELGHCIGERAELTAGCVRIRQALEFYANKDNYFEGSPYYIKTTEKGGPMEVIDYGNTARQALAGDGGQEAPMIAPHINAKGEFKSDKYPWCHAGFVPLKLTDPMARPVLWEYARQRESTDKEFSDDLRTCLWKEGYDGGQEEKHVT